MKVEVKFIPTKKAKAGNKIWWIWGVPHLLDVRTSCQKVIE